MNEAGALSQAQQASYCIGCSTTQATAQPKLLLLTQCDVVLGKMRPRLCDKCAGVVRFFCDVLNDWTQDSLWDWEVRLYELSGTAETPTLPTPEVARSLFQEAREPLT